MGVASRCVDKLFVTITVKTILLCLPGTHSYGVITAIRFPQGHKSDSRSRAALNDGDTPVLFVYDMVDTMGPPLPKALAEPFTTTGKKVPKRVWERTRTECATKGICVVKKPLSPLQAGSIARVHKNNRHLLSVDAQNAAFLIILSQQQSMTQQYATLVHELAHLFCGHLGKYDPHKIKDRRSLNKKTREVEAESVAYLVCRRLGIETSSAAYLAMYSEGDLGVPDSLSLQAVLNATKKIENLGK